MQHDTYLQRLEAERFDVSYLNYRPSVKTYDHEAWLDERKAQDAARAERLRVRKRNLRAQTVWDAGRFAAGARDEVAVEADKALKRVKVEN